MNSFLAGCYLYVYAVAIACRCRWRWRLIVFAILYRTPCRIVGIYIYYTAIYWTKRNNFIGECAWMHSFYSILNSWSSCVSLSLQSTLTNLIRALLCHLWVNATMAGMCCGGSEIEEVANMSTIVIWINIPGSSYLGVHPTDGRPGEDVFCASRVPSGQHGSHQVFKRTKIQKNQKHTKNPKITKILLSGQHGFQMYSIIKVA